MVTDLYLGTWGFLNFFWVLQNAVWMKMVCLLLTFASLHFARKSKAEKKHIKKNGSTPTWHAGEKQT